MRYRQEECGVLEAEGHFFICCINTERKTGGDGILNILFNCCTDNQNVFLLLGKERVFLSKTLQAQQAKLFCAHQMIRVGQDNLSDSSAAKYILSQ